LPQTPPRGLPGDRRRCHTVSGRPETVYRHVISPETQGSATVTDDVPGNEEEQST
jgi:hypothetical protein